MAHRRAKLTPFGRLLLIQRVEVEGWPAAQAAEAAGVSRATVHKWVKRFREEGLPGLEDRSSCPKRCPHALSPRQVGRVLRARRRLKAGPHTLAPHLGLPRSTIYAVLRRHGVSRLSDADRPTGIVIRYQRERPGELVHVDVKKLGRVPPGGGKWAHGRRTGPASSRGVGSDYLHVAVDDCSRIAYVEVHPDERGGTTGAFVENAISYFAALGIRVERVMTDNAMAYTNSKAFQGALRGRAIRHLRTKVYRPQTNGKAERFIQTLLREWAYARVYRSNEQRLRDLPRWLDFYNRKRPHTALEARPPFSRLSTT